MKSRDSHTLIKEILDTYTSVVFFGICIGVIAGITQWITGSSFIAFLVVGIATAFSLSEVGYEATLSLGRARLPYNYKNFWGAFFAQVASLATAIGISDPSTFWILMVHVGGVWFYFNALTDAHDPDTAKPAAPTPEAQ